ncbi:MAG TPA: periplasmic heavy metal sensor [Caulobacteraceae bacterium]|nr:periplasmic heavy metal sensor [Caulobacteraceae bacterium]
MRPRTLAIALIISLVVNVFVVGGFVGVFLGRNFAPAGPRPGALMAAANRLDPTDREVFRALMQDEVQRQGPTQLDARQARREAAALMRAPTFDRAAAGQALDRARADDMAVRKALENTLLDFAAKLDVGERTTLAEGLGRGPGWLARRAERAAEAAPSSSAAAPAASSSAH